MRIGQIYPIPIQGVLIVSIYRLEGTQMGGKGGELLGWGRGSVGESTGRSL